MFYDHIYTLGCWNDNVMFSSEILLGNATFHCEILLSSYETRKNPQKKNQSYVIQNIALKAILYEFYRT